MTKIAEIARITKGKGKQAKVASPKAAIEVITPTCGGLTCTNRVGKDGAFCSMPCYDSAQPKPHVAPCGDKACTDAECQARALIRQHLLENYSEQDRIASKDHIIPALHSLLADPEHATEDPEFFALMAIDLGMRNAKEGVHVQVAKPVTDGPAKAVRKPQVAKHQPRTTDGQAHPVVVTPTKAQEAKPVSQPKPAKSYTQADMDRAIRAAIDAEVARRVQAIMAAKDVQVPDVDRPITIVGHNGPNMVVERGDAKREGRGVVLPGFVVDNTLSIEPLDLGDLTLDAVVTSATRSPYNKALYRLLGQPALAKDCTYRNLAAIHADLAQRAAAKRGERKSERKAKTIEQAKAVAAAPASNKTHVWKGKPVTAKQFAYYTRKQQPVLVLDEVHVAATAKPSAKAKISTTDKAKVKAVMTELGVTKKRAKALLGL